MKLLTIVTSLLFLPGTLAAQLDVEMTARVIKLAKAPACSPTATHGVTCTDVVLRAGEGVDLSKFEDKFVTLTGRLVVAACPTLEVSAINTTSHYLQITARDAGGFKIGNRVRFGFRVPFLAIVPWFLANKPSFVPLSTYGTLMLDPLSLVYIQNYVALLGTVNLDVRIPNDTAFVDVPIYSQGVYLSLVPTPTGKLLNTDCFVITK